MENCSTRKTYKLFLERLFQATKLLQHRQPTENKVTVNRQLLRILFHFQNLIRLADLPDNRHLNRIQKITWRESSLRRHCLLIDHGLVTFCAEDLALHLEQGRSAHGTDVREHGGA